MRRRGLLLAAALAGSGVVLLVVAVFAVGGGKSHTNMSRPLASLYTYDRNAPFHEIGHVIPNPRVPVVLRNIQFADGRGGAVFAYLCAPRGKKTARPGVVMVPGSFGRQVDFLVECLQLAARGAVAMSMVTPFIQGTQRGPNAPIP